MEEERYNTLISKFRELIAKYGNGRKFCIGMKFGKLCVTEILDDGDTILFGAAFDTSFDDEISVTWAFINIWCFDIDKLEKFYDNLQKKISNRK